MSARAGSPDARQWADEPVRISPYDPAWPARFEEERAALERAIGTWVVGGIHHVGSTAVTGLAAKPVIDILVGVQDLATSRPCIDQLRSLGYLYAPYRDEEMHWFCKPHPSRRTHHLHLVPVDSPRFRAELAFRDYLRAHPEIANEYDALKHRLAVQFENDREAYTEAKGALIEAVVAQAEFEDRSAQAERTLEAAARWARGRADVRGLALVGSWARGTARLDSDLDLVLLTERPAEYAEDESWSKGLGATDIVRTRRWGPMIERRLKLASGLEVEVGVAPLSWVAVDPVDPGTCEVVRGGMRILDDPDGSLARLLAACA